MKQIPVLLPGLERADVARRDVPGYDSVGQGRAAKTVATASGALCCSGTAVETGNDLTLGIQYLPK